MRQFLVVLTLIICCSANFARAANRVDVSIGNITRPSDTSPLFNSFQTGLSWDTDFFKSDEGRVHRSLRIETGIGLYRAEYRNVRSMILAPVLHYQLNSPGAQPFIELSVGAAYLSETRWEKGYDISSRRLFADRIGFGYAFEEMEISLNYSHFSNAGLHRPNPGADMVAVRASFKL